MQVFFTATNLNIFCCHTPHIKRLEFQKGSIRYWWIRFFRWILQVKMFKCFIYDMPDAFHKHTITLNPVWILGLRLILSFAGLEVRVEAATRECQYFQTAKRVANGVIYHPLCSTETPLTALRRFIFLRLRVKTSMVSSVFNFQFSTTWINSFDSLDLHCLVLGDMILERVSDFTDAVDVSKPWI